MSRSGQRGLVLAAIVLLVAASCQPLSRPFQPDDKRLNAADFARLGTRGGIIITAPSLDDQTKAERFAGLLAAALRDRDIPAIAGPQDPSNRYVLNGRARANEASGEATTVSGIWRLTDPQGRDVMQFAIDRQVNADGWRNGDVAALALVAETVAEKMARQFNQPPPVPEPEPAAVAAGSNARIAIWSVGGLAEERSGALHEITQAALRARGLDVVPTDDSEALVLSGWVERERDGAEMERIVIEWTVLRPNGDEVGIMSQSNVVAVGDFERYWNDIAPIIARAAADGLIQMLAAR